MQQALATDSLDAEDRAAAEAGLLPLFDDLAYRYYLSGDGGVFARDALVPEDGIQPFGDTRFRLAVYRAVVEQWPELRELIPERPAALVDCAACGGSGRAAVRTVSGSAATTICQVCRGTGWTDPASGAG